MFQVVLVALFATVLRPTGSKFGKAGIYVLLHDHNVHKTRDFDKKQFVQDKKYNKKEKAYVERDALIRRGQPVSVLKVIGDRAEIVAPYEGWIKFGEKYAELKIYEASEGDVFQVRARKKTLVLNSNSFNGMIVDKLRKGTKVKVQKFEGASALISYPVYGWIDIVAAALNKVRDVKPKLVLSEVPLDMVNTHDGADAIARLLEHCGITCSVKRDGRLRKVVRVFVNKPRQIKNSKGEFVDAPSTTCNLVFNSMEDAQFALKQTIRLPTHILPLKWSRHYESLTA